MNTRSFFPLFQPTAASPASGTPQLLEPLEPRIVLNAGGLSPLDAPVFEDTGMGPTGLDFRSSGFLGTPDDFVCANFDEGTVSVGKYDLLNEEYMVTNVNLGGTPVDAKWVNLADNENPVGFAAVNSKTGVLTIGKKVDWQYELTHYGAGVLDNPQAVAVGDFNNDSAEDLAVTSADNNKVAVFFNKNDDTGTFKAPVLLEAGAKPQGIVAGDFNGDGDADLVVVNNGPAAGPGTISYFASNGNETFEPGVQNNAGKGALGIGVFFWDDMDPSPDGVAVTNNGANTVSVFEWDDEDSFVPFATLTSGKFPSGVGAGDINGDGFADLVVANTGDNTLGVFYGEQGGIEERGFDAQTIFFAGEKPTGIVVKDADGILDGRPGVAVSCYKDNGILMMGNAADDPVFSVSIGAGTAASKLVYTDADGTAVTVALSGKGAGVFYFEGTGLSFDTKGGTTTVSSTGLDTALDSGFLNNTTTSSSLIFSTKETNLSTPGTFVDRIGSLTPLSKLTAPTVDFHGIQFNSPDGLALMTQIRDVTEKGEVEMAGRNAPAGIQFEARHIAADVGMETMSPLKKLIMASWASDGYLGTPWIDTMAINGDMAADIFFWGFNSKTRQALKTATVAGDVFANAGGGVTWWIAHGGGTFGAVTIKGDVTFLDPGFEGQAALSLSAGGLGSVTVDGDAQMRVQMTSLAADKQVVGKIKVGGDWIGSLETGREGASGGVGSIEVGGNVGIPGIEEAPPIPTEISAGFLGSMTIGGSSTSTVELTGRGQNTAPTLGSVLVKGEAGITGGSSWAVAGGIGSLTSPVVAMHPGEEALQASWINTLTVANNFDSVLLLSGRNTSGNTLGTAKLGSVTLPLDDGANWDINGKVGVLDVAGAFTAEVVASSISTLKVGGDYDGSLDLTGVGAPATVLGTATIGGNLLSDDWLIGDPRMIMFGTVGTLNVTGNVGTHLQASAINTLIVGGDMTGNLDLHGRWLTGNNSLNSATISGGVSSESWNAVWGIGTLNAGKGIGADINAGWLTTLNVGNKDNPNANFSGDLTLTGTSPIGAFNANVSGGLFQTEWNVNGPVTSLKGGFMSGSNIEATSIGTLVFNTWMDGDLHLNGNGTGNTTVLGTATIGGGVTGEIWSLSGGIGTLTVNAIKDGPPGNFDVDSVYTAFINTATVVGDWLGDSLSIEGGHATSPWIGKATIGGNLHTGIWYLGQVWNHKANGGIATLDVKGNVNTPITGAGIDTLLVGGDYTAALNLEGRWNGTALGKGTIQGNVTSTAWTLGAGIDTLMVGGDFGTVMIDPGDPQTLLSGTRAKTITVGGQFNAYLSLDGIGAGADTLGTLEVKGEGGFGPYSNVAVTGGIGTLKSTNATSDSNFSAGQIGNLIMSGNMGGMLSLDGIGSNNSTVLKTATLGRASSGIWMLNGGIGCLTTTAGQFAPFVEAAFVNKINTKTDYTGILLLTGRETGNTWINSATIGGDLDSPNWILEGPTGDRGGIGTLNVGNMADADITAAFLGTMTVNGPHSGNLDLNGQWRSGNTLGTANLKGGLSSQTADPVEDTDWLEWNIHGGIGTLNVVGNFGNPDACRIGGGVFSDLLTADFLTNLKVNGNVAMDANLQGRETGSTAPTLGTAKITGDFRAAQWEIAGDVNSITATGLFGSPFAGGTANIFATGSIKSLAANQFADTLVCAGGFREIPAGMPETFINPGATLGKVFVNGKNGGTDNWLMSNTNFVAPGIGTASLKWIDDFAECGIYGLSKAIGGGGIGKVTYEAGPTTKWTWPGTANEDALALIHVPGSNAE
jgi:hypothetical protein